jgi:hypothetical protein
MAQGVPTRLIAAVAVTTLLGCGGAQSRKSPQAQVEAALQRAHGVLRGTFDNVLLELRSGPEVDPISVLVALPDKIRARGGPARDAAALAALRDRVAMLLLWPLQHAERIEAGEGSSLTLAAGARQWTLTLDEQGLPRTLRGEAGEVEFRSWLDTGASCVPKVAVLAADGTMQLRLLATGLVLDPKVFDSQQPPAEAALARPSVPDPLDDGRGPRTPQVLELPAQQWLVLADPGDWPGRASLLQDQGRRLGAAGQRSAGLPILVELDDKACLAIPFRAAKAGDPFVPGPGAKLQAIEPQRAAVVVVGPGDVAALLEQGRKQLAAFLAREGLRAAGPLRAIPFLEPGKAPTPDQLRAADLRLEWPLAGR